MKETLKDKNAWILAAIALLIGVGVTALIAYFYCSNEEDEVKTSIRKFLANNPKKTGQELLDIFNKTEVIEQ